MEIKTNKQSEVNDDDISIAGDEITAEDILNEILSNKGISSTSVADNDEKESPRSSDNNDEQQSSSSSDNEDESPTRKSVTNKETVTSYFDENDLFEKSKADVSVLLPHLYMLLKRTRKLVNLIHRFSVLDRHVKGQIKIKLQEIKNRLPPVQQKKYERFKDSIIDFKIQWNTLYIMLTRFILCSSIIVNMTQKPLNETRLKLKRHKKF